MKYDPTQINTVTRKAYNSVGVNHGMKVSLKTAFSGTSAGQLQNSDNAYLRREQNKQEFVKGYIDNADYMEDHTNHSVRKMINKNKERPRTSKTGSYLRQRSYTLTS